MRALALLLAAQQPAFPQLSAGCTAASTHPGRTKAPGRAADEVRAAVVRVWEGREAQGAAARGRAEGEVGRAAEARAGTARAAAAEASGCTTVAAAKG